MSTLDTEKHADMSLAHVGHARIDNSYDEATEAPEKAEIRARFLHQIDTFDRVATLPGEFWRTEMSLVGREVDKVIAFEWNEGTFHRALKYVPRYRSGISVAKDPFVGCEIAETDRAALMHMDVNHLMASTRDSYMVMPDGERPSEGARKKRWNRFRKRYARWDAVWLDYTSPLNHDILAALSRLPAWINHAAEKPVPVHITFLRAREQPNITSLITGAGGRFRLMYKHLAANPDSSHNLFAFEVEEVIRYTSGNGSPMGHLVGRYVKVKPPKPEHRPQLPAPATATTVMDGDIPAVIRI